MESLLEKQEIAENSNREEASSVSKVNKWYLFGKQFCDFILSLGGSIVLILPIAVIALIIVLKDPGNPFYMQQRVGKDGKPMKILKFRSMKCGADDLEKMLTPEQLAEYQREYKIKDDPRLIGYTENGGGEKCFGAMIRRTSIDELPQIVYNILLKGDMSIVGPRPILERELEDHYTPQQRQALLSVKPGLTGYWQAYARNNASYESGERQRMELYYVKNRSAGLDLKIFFQTIVSVIRKTGAE